MKKYFITIFIAISVLLLSGCSIKKSPAVKKSDTGICHQEGTNYYKNTKNFTPYDSIDECLKSGGRLPKK
jgi:PBP1b-binding outer membrane lipoprotein LpoB